MTTDKTPTEALAQLRHLYAQLKSQDGMSRTDRARIADGILSPAIAALEKWGQPAQAAEPVARLVIGKTKGGVSLTHMVVPAAYQLQEGVYALYTAPQPVAREPMTPEQIAEMMRDTWGCASIAPRHALEFARAVERAALAAQGGK